VKRTTVLLTILFALWAVLLLSHFACGQAPASAITLPCQVVRAIDGDTLDVDVTVRVRVRLLAANKGGCWAPEKNTPAGKAAADSLALAIASSGGEVVTGTLSVPIKGFELQDVFTFGRVLGNVWIDGQNKSLGEQQIALGHASSTKAGKLGQ